MKPEDMKDEVLQRLLEKHSLPEPDMAKKSSHITGALQAFEKTQEKNSPTTQGSAGWRRLTRINPLIGEKTMKKAYITGGALAFGVVAITLLNTTQLTQVMPELFTKEGEVSTRSQVTDEAVDIQRKNAAPNSPEISADIAPPPPPLYTPPAIQEAAKAKPQKMDQETFEFFQPGYQTESSQAAGSAAPDASRAKGLFVQGRSAEKAANYASPPAVSAPADMPIAPVPHYQGNDKFEDITDSPTKVVKTEPVSTFSIDVDTASYSFVRRQLNQGILPQPDSVRVEEMVNYFDYDYPLPESKAEPFKPTVTLYPTPWNENTKLMHIAIQGHDVAQDTKPRSNLVFLIDTSGSMDGPDRLPLLKNAFKLMVENLQPEDTVAIATYAGSAGVVLEPTEVADKQTILSAIDNLHAGGSTAGAQGIKLAYDLAAQHFDKEAVNRVFLATDGDFNVGITDPEELKTYIEHKRESGVFLSVLGFGEGNYNDALMQKLAQNGNGVAAYIDTLSEARKVLVEEASATIYPIAKDVKIQVEFNPARIAEYRLIGYQTRALNREDFNNDAVDAGDIGAGHRVTAIYEVTPVGATPQVDPLRYGEPDVQAQPRADDASEFAHVKIRYKLPKENTSKLISYPVTNRDMKPGIAAASEDVRFATAVAAFGEKLRGGKYLNSYSYDAMISLAQQSKGTDEFGYRAELINLMRLAKTIPAI